VGAVAGIRRCSASRSSTTFSPPAALINCGAKSPGRRRRGTPCLDRPTDQPPYLTAVLVVVQRHVLALLRAVGRIRLERKP
jgi:hypothetical protein